MSKKIIWFTGLSGSGKTTLANSIRDKYKKEFPNKHCIILDGDELRTGLCSNLGFSLEDRSENIRRAAEVANLFANEGFLVIAAFITPLEIQRNLAREITSKHSFLLCWINCKYTICEKRDVKGLYAKSKNDSSIKLTGKKSIFEEPVSADVIINTEIESVEKSTDNLCKHIINPQD